MMSVRARRIKQIDRVLLLLVIVFVIAGFIVFISASFGLFAKGNISLFTIISRQLVLGLMFGSIFGFVLSKIHYVFWQKWAKYFFLITIVLTLLVFIPGIGMKHGGALRWVNVGPITFQPVEFLKIGVVLFTSAILSKYGPAIKKHSWFGIIVFCIISVIAVLPLLLQPDHGTAVVIIITIVTLFFVAGFRWKHLFLSVLFGALFALLLVYMHPYVLSRITTYLHPEDNNRGASWQISQSLIAIGSGGLTGRGFGQSVQKFGYLPEPRGDSIFAVFAEEFGFIGATGIVLLFLMLLFRMYHLAIKIPDTFGSLVIIGIATLILMQSFFNIAAMLSLAPLSGLPLIFVSHGGTALAVTLA
jgi:cell division protein FtsW